MGDNSRIAESHIRAASRMATLAKLTADWEVNHRSYLDNFIDFVLGAVAQERLDTFTPERVSESLQDVFGLSIPSAVVHQVLRRAARRELVTSVGAGTYRAKGNASELGADHLAQVRRLEREQRFLGQELVKLSARMLKAPMVEEDALDALLSYIEAYFGPIMSSASGRGTITASDKAHDPVHRMIAAFIAEAADQKPQTFDYIVNFAKGSMLAAAVFSPPSSEALDAPFRDTWLILDTRILLRLLGYEGEIEERAALDYVSTARAQRARVGYFDFTLTEVRTVFDAAEMSMSRHNAWSWEPSTLAAYFLEHDLTRSDVKLHASTVVERWQGLGVEEIDAPSWRNYRSVVDEVELASAIEGTAGYRNKAALDHDVKALAAVMRFRQGRGGSRLEDCRGVFVTTNQRLLGAARRVEDMRNERWPVAIRDTDLAALVWVKTPLQAPDLPQRSLVATCLTVLRPTQDMWRRYVAELERRHAAGDLTDAEVMYVRQQYEQDNVELLVKTAESDFNFATSIDLLLADVKGRLENQVAAPLLARSQATEAEAEAARERIQELQNAALDQQEENLALRRQLDAVGKDLAETRTRAVSAAQRRASRSSAIVRWGTVVFLSAGVLASLLIVERQSLLAVLSVFAGVIVTVAGGALAPGRWLGQKVGDFVLESQLRRSGIDLSTPTGSPETEDPP